MTLPARTNTILLLVDALRYDHLGCAGHSPSPSPFMDRLMATGLNAVNAFTTGCPTQFAFPGIFTATLPLDDGGYKFGIRSRGTSFVECLKNAGYHTGGFVNAIWGASFFGYHRGADEFHHLFDIRRFLHRIRKFYIDPVRDQYLAGELAFSDCRAQFLPLLGNLFDFLHAYCKEKTEELEQGLLARSPVLHGIDFRFVRQRIRENQAALTNSPARFVERLLSGAGRGFVVDELLDGWEYAQGRESSAAYVVDSLERWIDRVEKPFFGWAHFIDVHDGSYTQDDIRPPAAVENRWRLRLGGLKQEIRAAGTGYIARPRYDYAIAYVDEQVRRLYEFLDARGLADDTLIVLASDHGTRMGGFPKRCDLDIIRFYEDLIRVPLAFCHRDLPQRRVDGLCSNMDLGPTLLDLLGIPVPGNIRGVSLNSTAPWHRTHVNLEHFGRGVWDIGERPLNACVRTRRHKLVFQSPPGSMAGEGAVTEMYDLVNDPLEMNNINRRQEATLPVHVLMRNLARRRSREIWRGREESPPDTAPRHPGQTAKGAERVRPV